MSRITVGIDGSANAHAALEWAVDEARLRGADLQVVHTWQVTGVVGGLGMAAYYEASQAAASTVATEAAAWASEQLGAPVAHVVECSSAVETLVREAADASLLVVGARGHGGFAGLVLGSVTTQLAHRAPCALVIVPTAQ